MSLLFFFKQKTAYEMRISDRSSDVCSSDLDFDGSGRFVVSQSVEQGQTSVAITTTHSYDRPGTHFAVARVRLNREGDPDAARQVENIAAARILRSEVRRVGKECVSTCRSRWWPSHQKKTNGILKPKKHNHI